MELIASEGFAGAEQVVAGSSPAGVQYDLRLTPLAGGGFVAVWLEEVQFAAPKVWARLHDANARPVGAEFMIDDSGARPTVAALASGGFLASWGTYSDLGMDGRVQIFDAGGAKVGAEFAVSAPVAGDQAPTAAAGLTGGGFVVLTTHRPVPSSWEYHTSVFDAAGQKVADIPVSGAGFIVTADVTGLSGGGFVVTWDEMNGGGSVLRAQIFTASGVAVGSAFPVGGSTVPWQEQPSIAALPDGGFVISWRENEVDSRDDAEGAGPATVKAQRYDASGQALGSEVLVAIASRYAVAGDVAATADGGFVVTWDDASGEPDSVALAVYDVKGRLFDAAGAAVGGEFLVNVNTAFTQAASETIVLRSGTIVAGWLDGSGFDLDVALRAFFPVRHGDAANESLAGDADRNAIHGRDGDDIISGGAEGDGLFGGAGNDRLEGGEGNDLLDGGDGDDTLIGGAGADDLRGGTGTNSLAGEAGNDVLRVTGPGAETAAGGTDTDMLVVGYDGLSLDVTSSALTISPEGGFSGSIGAGDRSVAFSSIERMRITTGSGNDNIRTGNGDDYVWSGEGDDIIDVGSGFDRVFAGDGIDGLSADASALTVWVRWELSYAPSYIGAGFVPRYLGIDYLMNFTSGSGDDSIRTMDIARDERISTSAGNDLVAVLHGRDVVDTGSGLDTLEIDYRGVADRVVATQLGGTALDGYSGAFAASDRSVSFSGVERFRLFTGSANDEVRGGDGDDMLDGGGGNDRLDAGGGFDTLRGGEGNDVLFYGGGLTGTDMNDGGAGTDTLVLQGNYPDLRFGFFSLAGIEGVSLQSGSVTRWGQSGANSYDYVLTTAQANVAAGQQLRLNGQSLGVGEDFALNGSAETDGGRFLVYGGHGADTLTGGSSGDIFFFEAGRLAAGDRIAGGGGSDAVVVSGAAAGSGATAQVIIATGMLSGVEALSFNGRFATDPSARPSYDVAMADGNLAGGSLIVNGSSLGADQSLSFNGLAVGDGHLRIFGGAGGDVLKGGTGNDVIEGGALGDAITSGSGADRLVYRTIADSSGNACDVITDFHFGNDRIDLSLIDANVATAGDQAFAFVGSAAFSGKAGELRAAFDSGTNLWAIQGDVDGDRVADFQLYVSTGAGPPPEADFIL
ncbi:MAG TPA: calcium-binding protein [Allosphingosinicella sp.]